MALIFYDTETTGINTDYDQILQFGAIKTDSDLRVIEKFECRSSLLPNVVPSPGALKVTKTTVHQLIDPSLPSHYQMVRAMHEKLKAWSPGVFIGHNSMRFDEHLLRQALFKTLHPLYLTNTNGNCRSDSMRIVQAVSIYAPNLLRIPVNEKGKQIFKLDQLAPLNGFNHEGAHEAMADVEATIHICRLVSEQAPNLWSNFMRFAQKAAVIHFVLDELFFSFSDFYFGKGYSWVVTAMGLNPNNNSEVFVFNLSVNPDTLIGLNDEELEARLTSQPKPVRSLRANAFPIISPFDDVPDEIKADAPERNELNHRAKMLQENTVFRNRLISAFINTREVKEPSEFVEQQIYDHFIGNDDHQKMEVFHEIDWSDRENHLSQLQDERLKELGLRLIYSERPEVFSTTKRKKLDKETARRIMGSDESVPWLTLPKAIDEVNDLLAQSEGDDFNLLSDLRKYLIQRSEEANLLL